MIKFEISYEGLAMDAKIRGESILRVLFDDYIYPHISKQLFEKLNLRRNNSAVQITDHETSHIEVKIKAEGVTEQIG